VKGDFAGWPPSLCAAQLWTGSVNASSPFSFSGVQMQQSTATSEGFPVCTINISAKVNDNASSQTYDPGFTLSYKNDSAVSLVLPLPTSLQVKVVTIPTFTVTAIAPVPVVVPPAVPPVGQIKFLWALNGSIVNNGQTIQSYSIDPVLNCLPSDGTPSTLGLDSIFATTFGTQPAVPIVFATSAATTSVVNNPTVYQTVWLGYSADTAVYDTLAPLSAWQSQSCALGGIVKMTINGTTVNSPFSAKIPFPPKRAAMSIRTLDCAQPIASPNTISFSASTSGSTCSVFGADLDLASQLILSGDSVNLPFPLTMLKDSSQARFTLQASDIARLKAGSSYNMTLVLRPHV
jgi:hypothetical protein